MSIIREDRFEGIFNWILNKRILQLIQDNVFDILNEKNSTHYYKEEVYKGEVYIRPIFDITDYDITIVILILHELENPDLIKEFHLDGVPINVKSFFKWLSNYLLERHLLFHIKATDPKTGLENVYCFYSMLILDYRRVLRIGYELMYK